MFEVFVLVIVFSMDVFVVFIGLGFKKVVNVEKFFIKVVVYFGFF